VLAPLALALWPPALASAQPASGGGIVLESSSLGAGGGAMQSAAPGPGVPSRADVSLGSSPAIGVMQGGAITLEAGFWPTVVPVPEPSTPLLALTALASLSLLARRSTRLV
jgi:hypothetical protein